MLGPKFCHSCEGALVRNAKFCSMCGVRVQSPPTVDSQPTPVGRTAGRDAFMARLSDYLDLVLEPCLPYMSGCEEPLVTDRPPLTYYLAVGPERSNGLGGNITIDLELDPLRVRYAQDIGPLVGVDDQEAESLATTLRTPLVDVEWNSLNDTFVCSSQIPINSLDDDSTFNALMLGVARVWRRAVPKFLMNLEDDSDRYLWLEAMMSRVPDDAWNQQTMAYAATFAGSPELPQSLDKEVRESLQPWSENGLGWPFIPSTFASKVEEITEWCWGASERPEPGDALSPEEERAFDPMWAYLMPRAELDAGPQPRFMVCHSGHGVNSYFVSYVLETPQVFIAVQRPFGGIYMDAWNCKTDVISAGTDLAYLDLLLSGLPEQPEGRLIIEDSPFRGIQRLAWLHPNGEVADISSELTPVDAPDSALEAGIRFVESLWKDGLGDGLETPS